MAMPQPLIPCGMGGMGSNPIRSHVCSNTYPEADLCYDVPTSVFKDTWTLARKMTSFRFLEKFFEL